MTHRKKLGEIFIDNGIITQKIVERTLVRARKLNKRFGTTLEELGLVTGEELANALAMQYGYKVVRNFKDHVINEELLKLIPVEMAMQYSLFPLKKDKTLLALAMADPTETRIVRNFAQNNGLQVIPYIATKSDIHAAICKNYLGREPAASDQPTVLIVDDDKAVLTNFGAILSKNGFRVVSAMDGLEAFRVFIAEKPRVVLTDKEMPKLDGYGLLAAIRNVPEFMAVPVILITGRMSPEEEAVAFDRGFFDFIAKPVKDITLVSRVKRALLSSAGSSRSD
jgi:PleD family two-component response regulator